MDATIATKPLERVLHRTIHAVCILAMTAVLVIGFCFSFDRPCDPVANLFRTETVPTGDPLQCARAYANRISDPRNRTRAMVQIAQTSARCGEANVALECCRRLQDPYARIIVAAEIVNHAQAPRDRLRARKIIDISLSRLDNVPGLTGDARGRAAGAYATLGRVDQALNVLDRIGNPCHAVSSALDLLAQAYRRRQPLAAQSILEYIDRRLNSHDRLSHRRQSALLARLARINVDVDHVDRALAAAERIDDPRYRAESMASIARATIEHRPERARYALDHARLAAEQVPEPVERARALAAMVDVCLTAQPDRAEDLTRQFVAIRHDRHNLIDVHLAEAVTAYVLAGHPDQAGILVDFMVDPAEHAFAHAVVELGTGHAIAVGPMLDPHGTPYRKAGCLIRLADVAIELKRTDTAVDLLEKVTTIPFHGSPVAWRTHPARISGQAAERYARLGNTYRARSLIDRAVTQASRLPREQRVALLAIIARHAANARLPEKSLAVARDVAPHLPSVTDGILLNLIDQYAADGLDARAQSLVPLVSTDDQKVIALTRFAADVHARKTRQTLFADVPPMN